MFQKEISEDDIDMCLLLKNKLNEFHEILYPATKIYEIIARSNWGTERLEAKIWRKQLLSLTSMCRLHENVIVEKLPKLETVTKNVLFDIYCTLPSHYIVYPKRIRDYIVKEPAVINNKATGEYRKMGEILVFEK